MTRVLSIAAGVTLASLESWLGKPIPVVRAMPNMPALVGAGAAAIAGGRAAGPDDLAWAQSVLEAVGTVVTVSESTLDAVTGLSGSGPAYVFLLAEALIDAGVLVGLSRPVARQLAVQTLLGSARLLAETGDEPASLRAAVTSPGGTTAAGLRALEAGGVRPPCSKPWWPPPSGPGSSAAHLIGSDRAILTRRALQAAPGGVPSWVRRRVVQPRATKRVPAPVRDRRRGGRAAAGVQHDRLPADPVRPAAGHPGRALLPDP